MGFKGFKNLNRMMNELMPLIIQEHLRKRDVERRLAAQLQEYEAYGEQQMKIQREKAIQDALQSIFAGGLKHGEGLAYGPASGLLSIMPFLTPEGREGLPVDWSAVKASEVPRDQVNSAMARILAAQQSGLPVDENDLNLIIGAFDIDVPGKIIGDITKRASEEKEREVTMRGQDVTAEQQRLGWAQLGEKIKEREAGDGDKKGKGAGTIARMKGIQDELDSIIKVATKGEFGTVYTPEQTQRTNQLLAELADLNSKLAVEIELEPERIAILNSYAKQLKEGGALPSIVKKNKEEMKKSLSLTEAEYLYVLSKMRI